MAYLIKTTWNNGYRCGCCYSSWEGDDVWEEDLEKALSRIPSERPDSTDILDFDIEKISVTDGSTGKEIACASLSYPTGFGKSAAYSFSCWSGFTPSGPFEVVYEREGKTVVPKAWADVLKEMAEKKRQAEIAEAEKQKAEAEKKLSQLRGG